MERYRIPDEPRVIRPVRKHYYQSQDPGHEPGIEYKYEDGVAVGYRTHPKLYGGGIPHGKPSQHIKTRKKKTNRKKHLNLVKRKIQHIQAADWDIAYKKLPNRGENILAAWDKIPAREPVEVPPVLRKKKPKSYNRKLTRLMGFEIDPEFDIENDLEDMKFTERITRQCAMDPSYDRATRYNCALIHREMKQSVRLHGDRFGGPDVKGPTRWVEDVNKWYPMPEYHMLNLAITPWNNGSLAIWYSDFRLFLDNPDTAEAIIQMPGDSYKVHWDPTTHDAPPPDPRMMGSGSVKNVYFPAFKFGESEDTFILNKHRIYDAEIKSIPLAIRRAFDWQMVHLTLSGKLDEEFFTKVFTWETPRKACCLTEI